MGAPLPGATNAFKPKAAPASGVAPQQVGNVKFPGKVNTKIAHLLPEVKLSGFSNTMIGAALAALAGRIANLIPGLSTNGLARDAAIGAAVTMAIEKMNQPDSEEKVDVYNPRPSDPGEHGWRLM